MKRIVEMLIFAVGVAWLLGAGLQSHHGAEQWTREIGESFLPTKDSPMTGGSTGMAADKERCPGCNVQPKHYHKAGCDIEQCPYCGGQLISCDCRRRPPLDDRMPWTGVWPGVAECKEFGWYAQFVPGKGWLPCRADEPGAAEDLNRLHAEAIWDRTEKRFILRGEDG